MIETIIQVENGKYPFNEFVQRGQIIRVEDIQNFSCLKSLAQKKNEMIKKTKLIKSPFIISLIKIYQNELSLHYLYQHVPYSFQKYIQKYYRANNKNIVEMSSKLFIKKITYEIAMLISYLIEMKIQIDISIDNMGLTSDQKLKIFMNHRCKMGHKTQVSLVAYYNSRKQKIITFLEKQLNKLMSSSSKPNSNMKQNNSLFQDSQVSQSFYDQSQDTTRRSFQTQGFGDFSGFGGFQTPQPSSQQGQSFADYENSFFNIPSQSEMNSNFFEPQIKNVENNYSRQTTHNLGRNYKQQHNKRKQTYSSRKQARSHKNSFHFGNNFQNQSPRSKRKYDDDKFDTKSFTHSKSVRIELQQKKDRRLKKNRKDSFKVKITTFHQYEMDDCDPKDLFSNIPQTEEQIFNYFSQRGSPKQSGKQTNEEYKKYYDNTQPQTPKIIQSPMLLRRDSMPEAENIQKSNALTLEEKVKIAKQKAQQAMNRYKKIKKTSSMGPDNKFNPS